MYDFNFLKTLPEEEWRSGFAEIIKHSCIWDKEMFDILSKQTIDTYIHNDDLTKEIIKRNVAIKAEIVCSDEFETGNRMLLNFGHTIGHAIEKEYELKHGHAISIGMVAAAAISEEINNFYSTDKEALILLLEKFELPVFLQFDKEVIWNGLLSDKKRAGDKMNFVLLEKIGLASVVPIHLPQLKDLIEQVL